jgi:hypothetical protein
VFDPQPGAVTSSEAAGQPGQIRVTPPARLQPAERRRLRSRGGAGGARPAPADQREARDRQSVRRCGGASSGGASRRGGAGGVAPALADRRGWNGTLQRCLRGRNSDSDGRQSTCCWTGTSCRPASLRLARVHKGAQTRSHWLGTRREWGEGRWTSRAGPGPG